MGYQAETRVQKVLSLALSYIVHHRATENGA